jgi:hypothetical protein
MAGLLVVSFEPFESRDHDFAGREPVAVLAWDSDRRENLKKARLCGRRLNRIPSGNNHQVANRCFSVLDALIGHAAAVRVPEQVGRCLGQLRRIGGLSHGAAREEYGSGTGKN